MDHAAVPHWNVSASMAGTADSSAPGVAHVGMSLREITEVLLDAARNRRQWLDDFADEPVFVSTDLHQLITLYKQLVLA